ncbi:Putative protein in type-1 retrotransposable element R1DM [Araneus ventricosus]|uniref:RNase H type-1 domain-containing protein n=1 Tax=Araneus ventricosus TaxID=182803 RepID=A0A4Y2HFY2_ARAVE|nr:Putative protein in type-1 retrotransposable element R1DM [Araneus ventricosus]
MISLDVAGAFDNVSWGSILYLMGEAACPLNIFRLVRSYLRNRSVCYETQATRVVHEVNKGCPQGSCSGPLFWNIVADSLLNQRFLQNSYVQACADDLVLVIWGHNESQIAEQGRAAMSIIEEWGELNNLSKQPRLLKKIYTGALEPKALYGHGAWGHRLKLKTFCEYLNVVQRRPLLALTRAYRTSSTISLQVLAGVPPLDLRAIETYATFLVLRAQQDIIVYSESFRWENYVQMESPYLTHPAVKDGIGFDWKEPKGEGLEVFTDGSGINNRIGAAMVVLYFGQLIHSERVRLGDNCTVYQAELVGLKLAAEFVLTLTTTRRVNVYSDSRSALQYLADPTNNHPLVREVKRLLERARSERGVFLHWVKAHVGYHGNELADAEAKAATDSPSVSVDLPVSSRRFKCKLKSIMIQAWQDHWDYTPNKGRFTSSIIPNVSLKTHFWGEMAELFTGHGIGLDDRCACRAVGDAKHYIVSCPLTVDLRARLGFNPLDLSSVVRDCNLPVLGEIGRRVRTFLPYIQRH